jgi:hypothetical protein
MDAAMGALLVKPRELRRDAEINRTAELTLAVAYRRLLDQSADLQEVQASVQPLACALLERSPDDE